MTLTFICRYCKTKYNLSVGDHYPGDPGACRKCNDSIDKEN